MLNEVGHYALVLALGVSLVQVLIPLVGLRTGDLRLMAMGSSAAVAAFLLVAFAFVALAAAYVQSDFSVLNVYENSHSRSHSSYKISGVWGTMRARCSCGSSSSPCSG